MSRKAVRKIELTDRQEKIVQIVKNFGPITGEQIAETLHLTRATLRPDLAILTMSGILDARPRVGYYYNHKNPHSLFSKELTKFRVKEVKSLPVVVRETVSVYDAVVTMFTEDVGTLIVVEERGLLTGVVSRKDLLKFALGQADVHKVPVGVVMTRMPNIITVTDDDLVITAAKKLIDHAIDCLPVVRTFGEGEKVERLEVIGRFTKTNITRVLVEMGEGG